MIVSGIESENLKQNNTKTDDLNLNESKAPTTPPLESISAALVDNDLNTKQDNPDNIQHNNVTTYNWSTLKPSIFCKCFPFAAQLVFIAAMGSFLFGYNIALLNTSLSTVNAEFQMCGPLHPILLNAKLQNDPEAFCRASDECMALCTDTDGRLICPGGSANLNCSNLKWYNASLTSAVLIGGVIGAMTGGRFLIYGRRWLLLLSFIIFTVGSISSMCSNSFSALMWARLIVGYAVGLVSVGSPTYIAEVTSKKKRGFYGVLHQFAITFGILIPMLLGLPLAQHDERPFYWEPTTFIKFWWRFMFGLAIVPAIIAVYFFLYVYNFETPIWYLENHHSEDAKKFLEKSLDKEEALSELDAAKKNIEASQKYIKQGLSLRKAIVSKKYSWVIIFGLILAGLQQFSGINVFMTSSNDLFERAGLSPKMQTLMTIIMALINIIMTIPTIFIIDRFGRKSLLAAGSTVQCVFLFLGALGFWIDPKPTDPNSVTQILAIVSIFGFVIAFAVAFGPVLWVYLFEIYPMEIKNAAAGLATAFNWLSGIIIVFIALVIRVDVAFTVFFIIQLIAVVVIFVYMKETKGLRLGETPFIAKATLSI